MSRILIPVVTLLLLFGVAPAFGQSFTVDEILANISNAHVGQSEGRATFRQSFVVRALFLTWRFSVDIAQEGDSYTASIGDGAPAFMPATLPVELLKIERAIDTFQLTLVGEETDSSGRKLYVLEGKLRSASSGGAQSGRLWVDASEWYIARAHLAYTWGRLEVEQEYRIEEGRRVLHRQGAVARPLGARVDVEYVDYWFDEA